MSLLSLFYLSTLLCIAHLASFDQGVVTQFLGNPLHTNNWAVIVSTSRYWFNYRHTANALSLYRTVKRLGLPDERIILMLSDDVACNPRNSYPAQVFNFPDHATNLYGLQVEVDYRGFDVTVENFLRLVTDRHPPEVPTSKRLMSNEGSNVLFYITGHGGEEFLKFSDAEQISAQDLADAFEQMHQKGRYREVLFMSETCEAATLHSVMYSPNILAIGSAKKGEKSYSLVSDSKVGVPIIDRFTYYFLGHMERVNQTSKTTLQTVLRALDPAQVSSTPEYRGDLFPKPLSKVRLTDFFSERIPLYVTPQVDIDVPLDAACSDSHRPNESVHRDGRGKLQKTPAVGPTKIPMLTFPVAFWNGAAAFLVILFVTSVASVCNLPG